MDGPRLGPPCARGRDMGPSLRAASPHASKIDQYDACHAEPADAVRVCLCVSPLPCSLRERSTVEQLIK